MGKNVSEDRAKMLEAVMGHIHKKYGDDSLMRLGENSVKNVETFSTGSLSLDAALGIGGFPRGRISEIYAQESVGKTTLTLHAAADAQRKGGVVAFIDAEHALDPGYARHLGVNLDELLFAQPTTGEEALNIIDDLTRSNAVDLIIVDSVSALIPKAELEGQIGDQQVALQARMMSQALRKITGSASESKTAIVFINQLREAVNAMGYGPKHVTSGGKALKFYASVRIMLQRVASKKQGTDRISNTIKATVDKNKMAPPYKIGNFDIILGEGISKEGQILDAGSEHGIIKKSGAYFKTLDGETIGQGFMAAHKYLQENTELRDKLWNELEEVFKKLHVGYESEPELKADALGDDEPRVDEDGVILDD